METRTLREVKTTETGEVHDKDGLIRPRMGKYFIEGKFMTYQDICNAKRFLEYAKKGVEQLYKSKTKPEIKTVVYQPTAYPPVLRKLPEVSHDTPPVPPKSGKSNSKFKGWYVVKGQKYESAPLAHQATGISIKNIQRWCKANKNNCSFLKK